MHEVLTIEEIAKLNLIKNKKIYLSKDISKDTTTHSAIPLPVPEILKSCSFVKVLRTLAKFVKIIFFRTLEMTI